MNMDDAYKHYAANKKAADEAEKAGRSSWVSGEFTGLDLNVPKPLRFLGNAPIMGIEHKKGDAKLLQYAQIQDDKGGFTTLIYPTRAQAPDHILWRIILAVKAKTWNDATHSSTFNNQFTHPDLWDKVVKGGFAPTSKRYQYSKGWEGSELLYANVIDRTKMEWHRANKKAFMIAKSQSTMPKKDNPSETITITNEGLSSFASMDAEVGCLSKLFGSYGNWNNYDILLTRHDTKQNSLEAINASTVKDVAFKLLTATLGHTPSDEEVKAAVASDPSIAGALQPLSGMEGLVSVGPLTEEEKSWELWDIDTIRPYTSYTSIKFKIGKSIALVDATLGTHFVEELDGLVKKEQAEKHNPEAVAAEKAEQQAKAEAEFMAANTTATPATQATPVAAPVATPTPAPVVESAQPVATRRAVQPAATTGLTPDKIALIPHWAELTDTEKGYITDVVKAADGSVEIKFNPAAGSILVCEKTTGGCGHGVPSGFSMCPYCGAKYTAD